MPAPKRSDFDFKPGDRVTTLGEYPHFLTKYGEVMREQDESGWITVRWDEGGYSDIRAVVLDPDPRDEVRYRELLESQEQARAERLAQRKAELRESRRRNPLP